MPGAAQRAFSELESRLDTLRGRHFFGVFTGPPPAVYEQIGPGFEELEEQQVPDPNRPLIEFYRRHDEIDLLVPAP